MSAVLRPGLAVALAAVFAAPLPADDKARPESPRARATALYGLARMQQREDRLVTACRTLEEAVRLDPEALPPRVDLIPLYVALGRPDDAVKTAAAVVEMDPGQGPVWITLAKLRHDLGQTDEAVATLQRCLSAPALENQPTARAAAGREMGRLLEPVHIDAAVAAYRLAVTLYATVPAAPPAEVAEAAEGLGRTATRKGLYPEAEAALAQARTAFTQAGDRDRAARIDVHLARVAVGRKNWKAANDLLDQYILRLPRDVEVFALKAQTVRGQFGEGAGVVALAKYITLLPDFLPLKVLLADEYRRNPNDRGKALDLYRHVLAREESLPAARGLIACLVANNTSYGVREELESAFQDAMPDGRTVTNAKAAGRARAIITAVREAAREKPNLLQEMLREAVGDLRNRTGFGRGRGFRGPPPPRPFEAVMVLVDLAESTRQLSTAEELLRNAITEFGFNNPFGGRGRMGQVSPGTVEAYLALFRVLRAGHKHNKHEEVLALCREGLERDNAMGPYFHYFAASSLMRMGKGPEALTEAEEAIRTLNDDGLRLATRLLKMEVLTFLGRYDEAVAFGRKLLDPEDERDRFTEPEEIKRIRLVLANVYTEARQFDRAEALIWAALELAPEDATLHNSLGYLLADQGRQLDEAERLIRRALDLDRAEKRQRKDLLSADEENAAYLDSLGWVLFRKGRLTEARDWLKKAAALPEGEGDPVVWDHLGDAYARLNETAQAKAAWEKALKWYADERRSNDDARKAEVRRKLERLKSQ